MEPPIHPLTLYGYWCNAPLQLPTPIATPSGAETDVVALSLDVHFHIDDEFIVLQAVELSRAGTRIAGSTASVNIVSSQTGEAWLQESLDRRLDLTMAVKDQIQQPESRLRGELIKIWSETHSRKISPNLGVRIEADKNMPWLTIVAMCLVVTILVLATAYFAIHRPGESGPDITDLPGSESGDTTAGGNSTSSDTSVADETADPDPSVDIRSLMHYAETDRTPTVRRSVNVVWSIEPSEAQLREAARMIRNEDPDFDQILISHYTPDHGIEQNDTAWATTNFDPQFSLHIRGIMAAEIRELRAVPPADGSAENLGYWLDSTMKCRLAIDRLDDSSHVLTHRLAGNDTSSTKKLDKRGSKFYVPDSTTGEYYTIAFDGALLAFDYDGRNGTFTKFDLTPPEPAAEDATEEPADPVADTDEATDGDNQPSTADETVDEPTEQTTDPSDTTETVEPEPDPEPEPEPEFIPVAPAEIKHKSPVRSWHYRDGTSVEASYVCRIALDLSLRRADTGEIITVKTSELLTDDVIWMRKWERRGKLDELDNPRAWGGRLKD